MSLICWRATDLLNNIAKSQQLSDAKMQKFLSAFFKMHFISVFFFCASGANTNCVNVNELKCEDWTQPSLKMKYRSLMYKIYGVLHLKHTYLISEEEGCSLNLTKDERWAAVVQHPGSITIPITDCQAGRQCVPVLPSVV